MLSFMNRTRNERIAEARIVMAGALVVTAVGLVLGVTVGVWSVALAGAVVFTTVRVAVELK